MLDNILVVKAGNNMHNVVCNSVAGTLIKSSAKSKILRFHVNSILAKQFFDEECPHRIESYHKIPITVLQVMLMANDQLYAWSNTRQHARWFFHCRRQR